MSQADWKAGDRYRVVKGPCQLSGMKPIVGGQQGWSQQLQVGDIITCAGVSWTMGDGVPVVKWCDGDGKWLANDCMFDPSDGGMWNLVPKSGYLEPVK